MKSHVQLSVLLGVMLVGSGCQSAVVSPHGESPAVSAQESIYSPPVWEQAGHAVDGLVDTVTSTPQTVQLFLYRFDPAEYDFRFVEDAVPHTVSEWAAKEPHAQLIANGVYFESDGTAAGLLIADGHRRVRRSFDWDKSAFVRLDGVPVIIETTSTSSVNIASVRNGAQTYPYLIKHGVPAISTDSGLIARRTFIGTDTNGRVIIGALSGPATITLYQLAQRLMTLPVSWTDVVNLDGGPSSGLVFNGTRAAAGFTIDSQVPVPNALIVEPKQ